MFGRITLTVFFVLVSVMSSYPQDKIDIDFIDTPSGKLEVWCIGHGTLMFRLNDFVIHVDPVSREGDYDVLPDADIILVTHSHGDHLDPSAISKIRTPETVVICNEKSSARIEDARVFNNGDSYDIATTDGDKITVEAVPAYNIEHERSPGNPFHPRGEVTGI